MVSFFYGILSAGLNEDGHIFFSIFLYKCREKNIYRTAAEHEVKPESSEWALLCNSHSSLQDLRNSH